MDEVATCRDTDQNEEELMEERRDSGCNLWEDDRRRWVWVKSVNEEEEDF
jgi:hypothetical protein